jgi:integrase
MPKERHQNGWLTIENGQYYGHYNLYVTDPMTGCETRKQPMFVIGSASKMRKWEAEEVLRKRVESKVGPLQQQRMDPMTTFNWFVENRYVPMRSGGWGEATRETNDYDLKHYLAPIFSARALGSISEFELQVFLNQVAIKYSDSVVRHCYALLKSIFKTARKQKFIDDNPAEDLVMPKTKPVKKPTTTPQYIRALYEGIEDPRDHALMCAALFCAPRTSEAFGLTWKSYREDHFQFSSTAWRGKLREDIMKTDASFGAVYIPEEIRWSLERWRSLCEDTNPDALMFPTTRVGKSGVHVPMHPKNFMKHRIWPISDKLGVPRKMVTFQVMRRTLATDLQEFGSLKDAQTALRHKNPGTTAGVYIQPIDRRVASALEARTHAVLSAPKIEEAKLRPMAKQSGEQQTAMAQPQSELLSIAKCRPRVKGVSPRKNGSSGRTRTYNPPVNRCSVSVARVCVSW